MMTAVDLVSLAGGVGGAWLAYQHLLPWLKKAAKVEGTSFPGATRLPTAVILAGFLLGVIATRLIFRLWG